MKATCSQIHICKTIFVTLEVQFHHQGGLVRHCYFELDLYFHPTNYEVFFQMRATLCSQAQHAIFFKEYPQEVPPQEVLLGRPF